MVTTVQRVVDVMHIALARTLPASQVTLALYSRLLVAETFTGMASLLMEGACVHIRWRGSG